MQTYKLLLTFVFIILSINIVSAFDFDNVKQYDKSKETIKIVNAFGLGNDIAEYKLVSNTDQCLADCYAIINVTLYKEEAFFDNLMLVDKNGRDRQNKLFKLHYLVEDKEDIRVDDYGMVCNNVYNKTTHLMNKICNREVIGSHEEEVITYDWKRYKGNEDMPIGDYQLKISVKKDIKDNVDWIIDTMGIVLDDWAWWNNNWDYKRNITIQENAGQAADNYTVWINLTFSPNMSYGNFSDIRFVDATESIELGFWQERLFPNISAEYRVNVPNLVASDNVTIFAYYGNPTAAEGSNASKAFEFFDNFTNFDTTTKWDCTGSTCVADGNGNMTMTSGNNQDLGVIYKGKQFDNVSIEVRLNSQSTWGAGLIINKEVNFVGNNKSNRYTCGDSAAVGARSDMREWDADGTASIIATGISTTLVGTWYTMNFSKFGDGLNWTKVDDAGNFHGKVNDTDTVHKLGYTGIYHQGIAGKLISVDWVKVRTYHHLEPNAILGTESEREGGANVALNTPANGEIFKDTLVDINCSATNSSETDFLLNITIQLPIGANNFTANNLTPETTLLYATISGRNLSDATYNWTCIASDTTQTESSASTRTFTVDTRSFAEFLAPTPEDNTNITVDSFSVKVDINETFFANLTFKLFLNDVLNNTQFITNSSRQINYFDLEDANYKYNVTVGTTTGRINTSETRSLRVHTEPTAITIFNPNSTIASHILGNNLTLNWSLDEGGENLTEHISNCSYTYPVSIGGIPTSTEVYLNNSVCTAVNETSFQYLDGFNSLNFTVTEEFNLMSNVTVTWQFSLLEKNVTANDSVFETSSQSFEFNFSTLENIVSITSDIVYNGTSQDATISCISGNCTTRAIIDIPLIESPGLGENLSQNKSYFFNVIIFNGTSNNQITTSTRQQNVTKFFFGQCNTTQNKASINFSHKREDNLALFAPWTIKGNFDYYLGSGKVFKKELLSEVLGVFNKTMCISNNVTYRTNATIEYFRDPTLSVIRNHFLFEEPFTENVTQIDLLSLNLTEATSFILKVENQLQQDVQDALVITQRYYPDTDTFVTAQKGVTGQDGKTVGFFKTETVDYRFIIEIEGVVQLITPKQKVVPETAPFTLVFRIGQGIDQPWIDWENLTSVDYALFFNDTTNITSFVYTDTSSNFTRARLWVKEIRSNESDITVCNVTSTNAADTLNCDLGSRSGTFSAIGYNSRLDNEKQISIIMFKITTAVEIFGLEGLIIAWFIILTATLAFIWNPTAMIMVFNVITIFVNIIGLATFSPVYLFGMISVSIILVILMRT